MPFVPDAQQGGATPSPVVPNQPTGSPAFVPDAPAPTQTKKKGIFSAISSGIGESAKKRFGQVKDTFQRAYEMKQNPLETAVQTVGTGIGFAGDILGVTGIETLKAATPDFIEKGASEAGMALLKTPLGQSGLRAMQAGTEKYDTWKKANPRAAANLEGVVNIASLIPVERLAAVGLKGTASLVKNAAKQVGESAVVQAGKEAVEQVGEKAIKTAAKAGEVGGFVEEHGLAQATGYRPETIKRILDTPDAFKGDEMAKIDRGTVADQVSSALDTRLKDLSEVGSGYNDIRATDATVPVPTYRNRASFIDDTLKKYGVTLDDSGRVVLDKKSKPLSTGDVSSIERFVKQYGGAGDLTPDEFLNIRSGLSELSNFDVRKTTWSEQIARDLRSAYDEAGKKHIPGLEDLDKQYAPEVKQLNKLKKDYLNPDGTLKDAAINRIANATGKGKDALLERLEGLVPGITENINILKAIEDIKDAGQRPGTYTKGAVAGATAGAAVAGPGGALVGGLLGTILTTPQVAVPMLRAYAKVRGLPGDTIDAIINKMRSGAKLLKKEKQVLKEAIEHFDDETALVEGETPNPKVPSEAIDSDLTKAYEQAVDAKEFIDQEADNLALDTDGIVVKAPLKGRERALEKVMEDYGGDVSKITDLARNTVAYDTNDAALDAFARLRDSLDVVSAKFLIKGNDRAGYIGGNIKVRTPNGHVAEIQVNSIPMLYAKMPKNEFVKMFGAGKYNELLAKYGVDGGEGHEIYEKIRKNKDPEIDEQLIEESLEYYQKFY